MMGEELRYKYSQPLCFSVIDLSLFQCTVNPFREKNEPDSVQNGPLAV